MTIPTYERAGLLRRAIESVLAQSLTDFELFVADNASTDATGDVVASYDDPRITYLRHRENLGIRRNLSMGFRLGSAPHVAILQDDDVMLAGNLEAKVAVLEAHPEVALAHAAFQFIDIDDRVVVDRTNWCGLDRDALEEGSEFIARTFAGGCRVNLSSAVVRRTAAAGVEFAEEEGTAADIGVWLRVALHGSVAYIDEPLTAVRRHSGSDSVRSGAYRLATTTSYRPSGDTAVSAARLVKQRFLDAHGSELADPAMHRRMVRASSRVSLLRPIDREMQSGAALATTARDLARAARTEPTVLTAPATARILGTAIWRSVARSRRPYSSGAPEAQDATCERSTCRGCGCPLSAVFLDLGSMPLANALLTEADLDREEARYPLRLALCTECALVQTTHDVPREEIFGADYPYFSSVSDELLRHAEEHAVALMAERSLGAPSFVVEVASNDGYLARNFVAAGVPVIGVEPTPGPAAAARDLGVPTIEAFFGVELAEQLRTDRGRADVIIANNVMAHVPDLGDFVDGLAALVSDDGVITIENQYVVPMIDRLEFDTVYHEHYSYFSCTAIDHIMRRHGLRLVHVEEFPELHGGTLRWWVALSRRAERGGAEDARARASRRSLDARLLRGVRGTRR